MFLYLSVGTHLSVCLCIYRSSIFLGSKITADGDCSHEIKRCFLLGRKPMTNLESIPAWKSLSRVRLFVTPWTVVHGILQARILEWVAFPFSREPSQPRDRNQVPCIASGFFTNWTKREAQENWRGYLFLLQGIFPTQESNQGLLYYRQILYQLSYQEAPFK